MQPLIYVFSALGSLNKQLVNNQQPAKKRGDHHPLGGQVSHRSRPGLNPATQEPVFRLQEL
jgi:hypothetical protein